MQVTPCRRSAGSSIVLAWVALAIACGDSDVKAPMAAQDASTAPAEEQPSALSPSCVPPPDCLPIETPFVNVGVCCSETLRCGFDMSPLFVILEMLPDLDPSVINFDPERPCTPRSRAFIEYPPLPAARVQVPQGDDVLLAPECTGYIVVNTQLPGCCLPNDACGISTHLAASAFRVLSNGSDAPFTKPECVPATELNAQLANSTLAAWAHVPEAKGSCDYAGLSTMFPDEE